jgi:hypothetical protein
LLFLKVIDVYASVLPTAVYQSPHFLIWEGGKEKEKKMKERKRTIIAAYSCHKQQLLKFYRPPCLHCSDKSLKAINISRHERRGKGPSTIEICRHSCGIKAHGRYGKRPAQVDHTGDGAAMQYLKSILRLW